MKGNEIISRITQDKMPDIRQVRERCLSQPLRKKSTKRLRLSTAAAIVAAFLVFATAAYAVADYRRVETGGAWDIVILPDDDYGRQIYHERNEGRRYGYSVYDALRDNMYIRRINAERARFINEGLAGRIFTADGTAIDFVLAVPMPGLLNFGRHHLDDRGNVLYTAGGHQIGTIILFSTRDGELYSVDIRTKEEEEAIWGFNSTYDEVMKAFEGAVRLPTAYAEMFQPPVFNLDSWQVHLHDDERRVVEGGTATRATIRFNIAELSSIFDWCHDGMSIVIERARGEYERPSWTMYYLGGEAIPHDIAGVTVYELNLPETATHFVWTYSGLAYRFSPSRLFTHAQTMDVIRSMIE